MDKTSQAAYQDALDYIYSFVDYSRTHQEDLRPENFDLSRMAHFMEKLDLPQNKYPTIHVAGSKGKGSVSALCAAALQQAGYKVGLYTSPHLKDFEERIEVDRVPMDQGILVDYIEEIKPIVAQVKGLTTFEIMTGLGYLYFARQQVDIAVIEVGLGGRLDATNVITPLVSVITSLYLDHISILGDTLDKIAWEKGGIIKPLVPVVSAPQKEVALKVLQEIASSKKAPFIQVGKDYRYSFLSHSLERQNFKLSFRDQELQLEIPLLGDFQVINATVAYAALDMIRNEGFPLSDRDLKQGFKHTYWPARFEILRRDPPLVIDSAHNPASVQKLRETVDEFFPDRPLILVFGISEDKQLDGMLAAILPRTKTLITTKADHPRAMDPQELADRAVDYDCQVEVVPDVGQALQRGLTLAGDRDLVLVAGSIFVAATARIAWLGED